MFKVKKLRFLNAILRAVVLLNDFPDAINETNAMYCTTPDTRRYMAQGTYVITV